MSEDFPFRGFGLNSRLCAVNLTGVQEESLPELILGQVESHPSQSCRARCVQGVACKAISAEIINDTFPGFSLLYSFLLIGTSLLTSVSPPLFIKTASSKNFEKTTSFTKGEGSG